MKDPKQVSDFVDLAKQWEQETMFHSNTNIIIQHPNVNKIIAMGEDILPLIMATLDAGHWIGWFHVLREITGCNPVLRKHAGNVKKITNDWRVWYEEIYLKS
jgi:hypothetical protein